MAAATSSPLSVVVKRMYCLSWMSGVWLMKWPGQRGVMLPVCFGWPCCYHSHEHPTFVLLATALPWPTEKPKGFVYLLTKLTFG